MNTIESFVIEGLGGKKTLKGTIKVNGAKNAAMKAMAAAVLFDGPVELKNIPKTSDIETLSEILRKLGATVDWKKEGLKGSSKGVLEIDASKITRTDLDPILAPKMRGSVVLTGPILGRFGQATFPSPGGCVIGARPIDQFIAGYERMGATCALDEKACLYRIENKKGSHDADFLFDKITVGGTETLMMAAVLGKGQTVLRNCAMEPEIVNLAEWLNECGADIKGVGTTTIIIEGTKGKLLSPKKSYVAIPDRIEAGSYLILGALCASDMIIEDCRPDHLESLINLLKISGVPIETGKNSIKISGNTKPNSAFKAFDVRTHEYPGFATDFQPIIATYLTQVSGDSLVFETIYEGRLKYVEDLQKIGANITVMNEREIEIKGPTALKAMLDDGNLTAHDIRAGFAMVLAALVGTGRFTVSNVHLIDRGYERLEERLVALGASIKRL